MYEYHYTPNLTLLKKEDRDSVAKSDALLRVVSNQENKQHIMLEFADALDCYPLWPSPTVIISDGAYGVNGFPGDTPTVEGLVDWYQPHIAAWSRYALPETTLWFWGTEVSWATVHPIIVKHDWEYRAAHIWDKSVAHIAGNVNSKTIRRFPVVTEICVQYVRNVRLLTGDGVLLPLKNWLRHEWKRSGLPLNKTNEACGVKNAATRKYFTEDHLWYFPPPEMMERIVEYVHKHGRSDQRPYFSLDGKNSVTADEWSKLRAKWNHRHGITNVWTEPAVRGTERLKDQKSKIVHSNQKPVTLLERIITASSDPYDVIWEPFGGLCSGAVAALHTQRSCYSSEINEQYYQLAKARLIKEAPDVVSDTQSAPNPGARREQLTLPTL